MASPYKLMKVILREVTEDADFKPLADTETQQVYDSLRRLQRGHFSATTDKGLTVISASHGSKSFSFQLAEGFGPTDIMELCEDLLELVEPYTTVSAIRQRFLRKRKITKSDFSTFSR